MLFLHGILGRGSNWQSFARRWVGQRSGWGAALVDLRLHGQSPDPPAPHTLSTAADDVAALVATNAIGPVAGVAGHSLGGKVALAWLSRSRTMLEEAWILDATPSARPTGRGSELVLTLFDALEAVGRNHESREAFARAMTDQGAESSVVQWLGQNLRRDGGTWRLRLDVTAIRGLLEDHFRQDYWSVVERAQGAGSMNLVVAGRSPVYSAEDRERALGISKGMAGRVRVWDLPSASHWLHVDDTEGLLRVMTADAPSG